MPLQDMLRFPYPVHPMHMHKRDCDTTGSLTVCAMGQHRLPGPRGLGQQPMQCRLPVARGRPAHTGKRPPLRVSPLLACVQVWCQWHMHAGAMRTCDGACSRSSGGIRMQPQGSGGLYRHVATVLPLGSLVAQSDAGGTN